jgi:hypothetical protein
MMRLQYSGWTLVLIFAFVLAAGSLQAAQNFSFPCGTQRTYSAAVGVMHQFKAPLTLSHSGSDSVDVLFDAHYPDDWFAQWCQISSGTCYFNNQTIRIRASIPDTLDIEFIPPTNPPLHPGMGWAEVTVRLHADPLELSRCTYALYSGLPVPNASFNIDCSDNIRRLSSGTFTNFHTPMRNTAAFNDSLIVSMTSTLPENWFTQFCQASTGTCYTSVGVLPMPPGVPDTLKVDFFLAGVSGQGVADIAMRSKANPTVVTYCHYQVFLNMGTTGTPEPQVVMTSATRSWAEPNPFASGTTLRLRTDTARPTGLSIFGPDGRFIRQVSELQMERGVAQVRWDGRNEEGFTVPSGVYFYRFQTSEGDIRGMIVRTR